ncbi:hypothetical protein BDB00DRAFT_870856 [Zychaea mexicana]|uniref:uncharacterized protein n=1 Tax=Zychaea mexicana TaxID=64656 RepID=UPI0022FE902B|nr:uncharacterized protein BDB00DRAFT_870856 [Zychaea mexicana]KAI9494857.1 hypothetical protein BDB00DRAFT_870856 [Zychaea mexicana]
MSEETLDLLSYNIPHHLRPGTDFTSRQLLNMNLLKTLYYRQYLTVVTLQCTNQAQHGGRIQLNDGVNCRDIRMRILRQMDAIEQQQQNDLQRFHRAGQRKLNYEDVYNMWTKNDLLSARVWLDERLPTENNIIFRGNPIGYTSLVDSFCFGILSQQQIAQLQHTMSVCMDATYNITCRTFDIMYTIVICDQYTGTGYPAAYMFTERPFCWPDHPMVDVSS